MQDPEAARQREKQGGSWLGLLVASAVTTKRLKLVGTFMESFMSEFKGEQRRQLRGHIHSHIQCITLQLLPWVVRLQLQLQL